MAKHARISMGMKKQLNVKEAAELLGVHVMTVYRKVEDGTMPCYKYGSRILFDPDELEAWYRKECKQEELKG